MANVKVGIVEDDMIIARGIQKTLRELGYDHTEPAISYTAALEMIERERPDILLLDISLSGHKDGIDLAWKIKEDHNIPFIFLTANSDAATVDRAKKVAPPAYLVKPFNRDDLYTSIEICLYNFTSASHNMQELEKNSYIIKDRLFIKQSSSFVKVKIDDITHIESDKVYINVFTTSGKFLVRSTIQNYLDLIASNSFVRVHRSFAINVTHLDTINNDTVVVNKQKVPIGKTYRDELLNTLRIG